MKHSTFEKRVGVSNRLVAAALISFMVTANVIAAESSKTPSADAAWFTSYQRDSQLVQLPDKRVLNLYCLGKGSPTVILESGIGGDAYDWRAVQNKIAKLTKVCAYDRSGLGRSSPGQLPRDTKAEVADLEALLVAANLTGPYVLVGHSMGGYNVVLFSSRHPNDVAGVVLVDPSVENQVPIMEAALPAGAENDRRSVAFVRSCADPKPSPEVVERCARPAPASFPPDLAAAYVAAHGSAFFQTFASEVESFLTADSKEVIAEKHQLPDSTPFIVLTRGELSKDMPADQAALEWKLWNQMHNDLIKLSTVGVNRVVKGANHYIQLDKPDVVVNAVEEVVKTVWHRQQKGTNVLKQ